MRLYYAVVYVGDFIFDVYNGVLSLGFSVRGVWLIGDYFSQSLVTLAVRISMIGTRVYDVADSWLDTYNEIRQGVSLPYTLQQLINYADDLLNFIRYPFDWIADIVYRIIPAGADILRDPIGTILDTITRYTGLDADFLYNPIGYIEGIINGVVGELREISQNPFNWVYGVLNNLFPYAMNFLRDPDGWLIDQIRNTLPELTDFLRDPDTYIVEHMIDFIERFIVRYGQRLAKIAEQIIHMIY